MANFRISFYPFLLSNVVYLSVVVVCGCCLSVVGRRRPMAECLVSLLVVVAKSWLSGVGC
jgi:hypothetical protein